MPRLSNMPAMLKISARQGFAGMLIALLAVMLGFALSGETREPSPRERLATVALASLPREARLTLALIKTGGPFPYARDGVTFQNRERLLPLRPRGYYREYTVPTPGASNRGARRIVAGRETDYFYTDDHYRSFKRIVEHERPSP